MVSCGFVGRPVWTPRRYDALAEEGYQTNVIVYRSVNLISKGVSSVPWRLTKARQKGFCGASHPLLKVLQNPNPKQGGASFIESVISHLLLAGNAYVEVLQDGRGTPAELHALRPDRVQVVPGEDGTVAAYEYKVNGQSRLIDAKSVLHMRCFHPLNDWYGLSPLEACARSIDQHNCVASHNLSLMQNGGRPSGALIVGTDSESLTEDQREELRENLQSLYEGSKNAGRTLILEGDFRWQEMGLSPKDMDFLEGKRMSAREIAQAYGVPPMLVGIPGDSTFANFKEARLHLWEESKRLMNRIF
ncbi:MAG: phage portal protein [bacterium]|nr:phage portal protein [bacterium]